jgi:MFS family permease
MTTTTDVLAVSAAALGAAAAARSTWSPCGLSMLATITPLAEEGRGHRYRTAATWFIVGGLAGGITLGLVDGGLAAAVRAVAPAPDVLAAIALLAALATLAAELRLGGFDLPVHRRQVNERWLDQFRLWVYASGFGWQIGTGVATYIMTPALYLMILIAALTTEPWAALAVAAMFGLLRGMAVLLGRGITDSQSLTRFHQRFHIAEPVVWHSLVAVEAAVVLACAWLLSPWAALALLALAAFVAVKSRRRRAPSHRRAPSDRRAPLSETSSEVA